MKIVRPALVLVGLLVVLAACGAAAVAWALATESGSAWVIARLQQRTGAPIVIGELRGTLWHGLDAREITLDLAPDRARIERVRLRANLATLLAGTVTLTELAISQIDYERGEPLPNSEARSELSIPIRVVADEGTVEQFTITIGDDLRVIGPVSFAFRAEGSRVQADDVVASLLGFDVRGAGELTLGAELGISAEFAWETLRNDVNFSGSGRIDGNWPILAIHQDVQTPTPLTVEGELRLGGSPQAELELQWNELQWPGFAFARSPSGTMQISGWLDAYVFDGDGAIVVDEITAQFDANGAGTLTALDFADLELSNAFGDVRGNGRLTFEPLTWTFDIEGNNVNPAVRLAEWPGSLTVAGEFSGRVMPTLEFALRDIVATGELREQPINATGSVAFRAPNRWELSELGVDLSGNWLEVDGVIGAALALDVAIAADELDRVLPAAAGSLELTGRIAGTLEEPELSGSLEARGFEYGDYAAGLLTVSGEIVSDQTRAVSLTMSAETVRWRDLSAHSLRGVVVGTLARHFADFDIDTAYGTAHLLAEGGWSGELWQGVLNALELSEPKLGVWELAEPALFSFGSSGLELMQACILQRETRVCSAARFGTDKDFVDLEFAAFDVAVLEPLLADSISATGIYDAQVSLTGSLSRPTGTVSLHGGATTITIREVDSPPLEMPIEEVILDAVLSSAGQLELQGELTGDSDARVTLTAMIADVWAAEPIISADFSGFWGDLSLLSLLSPDVGEVTGTANADLNLSGPLQAPAIRGSARWSAGQLTVPRWGFLIEGIEAEASSPDGNQLVIRATGQVGDGQIEVDGVSQLDAAARWPTELRIRGERLQAVRIPEAEIVVSPDLTVWAALPNLDVSGTFLIPYGRILLDALPPQAVEASPDVVVHGIDALEERDRPLIMRADIRVELGDDVRYAGQGLDVGLSGAMQVMYESGRSAVASGALNLSGEYSAYGQTLQIDQGRLLFTGPLDNPTLDVRAVRRVDGITAGVQLAGTVNAPVTRVFSEPAMSEADALSYLLFGRSLSNSEAQETATLESAAVSMGLRQALPIIQRVGETLGFDEFSVQTTTADTGELMAGKRIGPRLYIRYSYGLFNRIGGLLMRFSLSERLSLETRSGDNRAMDLIYTVERE